MEGRAEEKGRFVVEKKVFGFAEAVYEVAKEIVY